MTVDLWMVVAATGLTWALIMVAATPAILKDPMWAFHNREEKLDLAPWALRADRTAQNMKENLPLFVAIVLVVHLAGVANATSALGAEIFVGARVAHAAAYIAGLPYVRTGMWAVSIVGLAMVVSALF